MSLDLWSSAEDQVRIAALFSIRKVISSQDESVVDLVLKVRLRSSLFSDEYQSVLCLSTAVGNLYYPCSIMQIDDDTHPTLH